MTMTNSMDRQGILDSLTGIETTAKLLINAFVTKNTDPNLSINGIHREELINQTQTFLSKAQKLILNLSNTFNLTTEGLFDKKHFSNEQYPSTSLISNVLQNNVDDRIDLKSSPLKKTYSLSSVTLEDIIENRLTPKYLLSNYPLLHDPIQPNLVSLARSIHEIDNLDDLILKIYSQIFNHEERMCCNYNGINGKLPYPRHKRLLFDQMIKLTYHERHKIFDDNERNYFYIQCEKHFSKETSLTKYRGINLDQINHLNDEKQFISSLFRLIIPQDDMKQILLAKQDTSSQWNDNEMCIYHARPIHLLWIKQKWLEKYPLHHHNEPQKWSQCIDWAIESFLESTKIRPTKRKTMEVTTDHKRTKTSLTFEEKLKQIDRTKCDIFDYATQLLHLISNENKKNLPTLEQLQLIENNVYRFYWTSNQEKSWTEILDRINQVFQNESNENCRQNYLKNLLERNPHDQNEIKRLLQITSED